jgi:hypothetical protein
VVADGRRRTQIVGKLFEEIQDSYYAKFGDLLAKTFHCRLIDGKKTWQKVSLFCCMDSRPFEYVCLWIITRWKLV